MKRTGHKLSALLITYNEIDHIADVLDNLDFADEIIVVDSLSTDGTDRAVEAHGKARLIRRPFVNFTDQKAFALEQAAYDWVVFTDADERIPEDLRQEILEVVSDEGEKASAYYMRRTFMFKDKPLHFSGWQSDKNFRLFRKSKCRFDPGRIVHETLQVDGPVDTLKNRLIHYSYNDYNEYKGKMIRYGQMRAREARAEGKTFNWALMILRPAYKFLNHYLLRLGILDGRKGIVISYLNALGVYARYKELHRLERENRKT